MWIEERFPFVKERHDLTSFRLSCEQTDRNTKIEGEPMFGIGLPEVLSMLIIILILFVPMIIIIYILLKSDRSIRAEEEELSSEIKQLIETLSRS